MSLSANVNVTISPQGYQINDAPVNTNPFWDDDNPAEAWEITAGATVDNTTGTPAVNVEKTQTGNNINFDFAFTGIKGEPGATGETGATGPQGPQGETGATGATPDITMTASVDDTTGTPAVTVTKTGAEEAPSFSLAFTGLKGEQGAGADLPDNAFQLYNESAYRPTTGDYEWQLIHIRQRDANGDLQELATPLYIRIPVITKVYTNLSLTNENGVYTLTGRRPLISAPYYEDVEIGTFEIPEQPDVSNLIAEVTDAIVENIDTGYDFHTITETENNGTRNAVGSFYLAREQVTQISGTATGFYYNTVNQSGETNTHEVTVTGEQGPQGETGATGATPDITMTATVDDTTGTAAVTVTKTGTEEAPAFALAFTGLKGEAASGGANILSEVFTNGTTLPNSTSSVTGVTISGITLQDASGNTYELNSGNGVQIDGSFNSDLIPYFGHGTWQIYRMYDNIILVFLWYERVELDGDAGEGNDAIWLYVISPVALTVTSGSVPSVSWITS